MTKGLEYRYILNMYQSPRYFGAFIHVGNTGFEAMISNIPHDIFR
jgi:hypothetical protein